MYWDNHQDIDYKIDASIPGSNGSAFETRIHNGADEWNAVTGVNGFTFDDDGNGDVGFTGPCSWEDTAAVDIWVFYEPISQSGAAGLTLRCEVYDLGLDVFIVEAARIQFDPEFTWYTGTGNVPAGEVWVQELALHEFGHATGTFRGGNYDGHWESPPSNKCAFGGSEADWTMCPAAYAGKSYWQPLDEHDIDTFQSWY